MSIVKGKAKRFNGEPIDYVLLFDWKSGDRIGKAVPNSLGEWIYYYYNDLNCGVTYVADGCEPVSHGAYDLAHTVLPEFVDYIGSVNSMARGSNSNPILSTIPPSVEAGDILVLAVARRGALTVTDNNGGVWTLGADSINTTFFNQGTSIYYRTATDSDAGKVVSVNTSYSGVLITYLSIYRGKHKALEVTETISNPVRYDNTYADSVKNLTPIAHEGGFMVRAVSTAYAQDNNLAASKMVLSNMVNTGPQSGLPLRMQVAYKHLATADILKNVTYRTDAGGPVEVIPDVAIILNEIS